MALVPLCSIPLGSKWNANFLPSTKLGTICYNGLFRDCTSLTNAPELPATTLQTACYASMFEKCTSLEVAPKLPATELAEFCYYHMFNGCESLKDIELGYQGEYDDAPRSAFEDWVKDVAENGTFHYKGQSTVEKFGFPSEWKKVEQFAN